MYAIALSMSVCIATNTVVIPTTIKARTILIGASALGHGVPIATVWHIKNEIAVKNKTSGTVTNMLITAFHEMKLIQIT